MAAAEREPELEAEILPSVYCPAGSVYGEATARKRGGGKSRGKAHHVKRPSSG
jgi:hypothetical protein